MKNSNQLREPQEPIELVNMSNLEGNLVQGVQGEIGGDIGLNLWFS